MKKLFLLASLFIVFITYQTSAQTTVSLRHQIQQILSTKRATVGIAINGNNGKDTLSINGEKHLPMQSVFKFHIALAILSEIDRGKFSLEQKIKIQKEELLPGLYSPLRDTYPDGATLPISEILKFTVSQSDNVGCDVLLKLIGGPQVVEKYFKQNHFDAISIKINEETMQKNWDLQFQNWTTPKATNEILSAFYNKNNKLLSDKSYAFFWKIMKETSTGQNRLKAQLPKNTIVAHKTGYSGTNKENITAAINDVGIVFLPNGQYYYISVFVTDSKEDENTNEKIIADISKAAWDYFTSKAKK